MRIRIGKKSLFLRASRIAFAISACLLAACDPLGSDSKASGSGIDSTATATYSCDDRLKEPATKEWSRILYLRADGSPAAMDIREFDAADRIKRSYHLSLGPDSGAAVVHATLNEISYGGAGEVLKWIHKSLDGTLRSEGSQTQLYVGGILDSAIDSSLASFYGNPALLGTSKIHASADGSSDTTFAWIPGKASPEVALIVSRDSAAKTETRFLINSVYSVPGTLAYRDTVTTKRKYLDAGLQNLDWEVTGRSNQTGADSLVIRYKNGFSRDSAFIFRNGEQYAAGKYEYIRVRQIETEIDCTFGTRPSIAIYP